MEETTNMGIINDVGCKEATKMFNHLPKNEFGQIDDDKLTANDSLTVLALEKHEQSTSHEPDCYVMTTKKRVD